jgi:hypothetical protein
MVSYRFFVTCIICIICCPQVSALFQIVKGELVESLYHFTISMNAAQQTNVTSLVTCSSVVVHTVSDGSRNFE